MSSTSDTPLSANNDVQSNRSTSNTLRKDPASSKPAPVSSSRLVKPRAAGMADTEDNPPSASRTSRLRKAFGVGSSMAASTDAQSDQKQHATSISHPGSRIPSASRPSPSTSPKLSKHALPDTSQQQQQPPPSRPPAMRSQSYSKRHASFDTPREVPMPSMLTDSSLIDPIALDDDDMERNQAAAAAATSGWKHTPRQPPQSSSRERSHRPTDPHQPPPPSSSAALRRASAAAASSDSDSSHRHGGGGMHIDLSNEAHCHPPHFARNNSAPTPPHTPAAERMDLRFPKSNNQRSATESENSSGQSGSGSEQISPAPESAQDENAQEDYLRSANSPEQSTEPKENPERKNSVSPSGRTEDMFKEGRLSTASLPLPRSYGAERVSRLPPPNRSTAVSGNGSGSGSGSDGGQQARTPTNFASTPSASQEESDFKAPSVSPTTATYRTSYPFAGMFARGVPLVPGQRDSSLMADVVKNTQPGTAWRSSGPFMRRDYSEEDSEEKSAISRGQSPKQPEIVAPAAPLHPFLENSTLTTPSASSRRFSFDRPSSMIATPGHEQPRPVARSSGSPSLAARAEDEGTTTSSPVPSADRASTASGSSGASSDLATRSDRLASSGPDRPVFPSAADATQPQGRTGAAVPRDTGTDPAVASRMRPATEPTPSASSSGSMNPTMTVDTTPSAYILEAYLPGYQRDEITLSTRKKRILHVVADGFVSGGGHFERRVSFGYDADMSRVRAEFNGCMLKITVPRRPTPQTFAASLGSSTTLGGGSSSVGGSGMFWRGRSNML